MNMVSLLQSSIVRHLLVTLVEPFPAEYTKTLDNFIILRTFHHVQVPWLRWKHHELAEPRWSFIGHLFKKKWATNVRRCYAYLINDELKHIEGKPPRDISIVPFPKLGWSFEEATCCADRQLYLPWREIPAFPWHGTPFECAWDWYRKNLRTPFHRALSGRPCPCDSTPSSTNVAVGAPPKSSPSHEQELQEIRSRGDHYSIHRDRIQSSGT